MIEVSIEELAFLVAGKRPRLEVGYIPHEVAKFFGSSKTTAHLSTESARHILEGHGNDIGVHEIALLPVMLQRGSWINDRSNHCAVIFFSEPHDWHFRSVVKVTEDRRESLVVSLRRSRRKSVKRTFNKGQLLRAHW